MQGKRLYQIDDQQDFGFVISETPRSYGLVNGKYWYCCTPNGLFGNLSKHTVVENPDGTITVTPSILVNQGKEKSWHGYLTNGVWNEC